MSKIGRKPINIDGVAIQIDGQAVHFKGPKSVGVYTLPQPLKAAVKEKQLLITVDQEVSDKATRMVADINCLWGLHHALLQNKVLGACKEFEKKVKIVGLGCKAEFVNKTAIKQLPNKKYVIDRDKKTVGIVLAGEKKSFDSVDKGLLFILGKSHFFYFVLPQGITVEIDKTGQNLIVKSIDPVLLGLCVSKIKQLRKPEPYKGTGIREENEIVRRKAGKTKAG
ncbi:50S ribosomal protein L6 [bacterium]|nr:MAG: 50S ribosomal protein L6 [bacterium]QQR62030.1 MAG: 50S ribosomal protein L6 [bacterium]QQR62375.1 MAG: 50S ribosomal protein L6 [bacterium]